MFLTYPYILTIQISYIGILIASINFVEVLKHKKLFKRLFPGNTNLNKSFLRNPYVTPSGLLGLFFSEPKYKKESVHTFMIE